MPTIEDGKLWRLRVCLWWLRTDCLGEIISNYSENNDVILLPGHWPGPKFGVADRQISWLAWP